MGWTYIYPLLNVTMWDSEYTPAIFQLNVLVNDWICEYVHTMLGIFNIYYILPSGQLTVCYGTTPCYINGKSTMKGPSPIAMLNY